MNDYKALPIYEILRLIKELSLCKHERKVAAGYLIALRSGNPRRIEEHESFGKSIRHMIMNKRSFERGLLFGFTSRETDKYGWLERPSFLDYEKHTFPHRTGYAVLNSVEIGKGINGIWTYGISHFNGSSGISVWGKIFNNKRECLTAALEAIQAIMINNIKLSEKDSVNHSKTSSKKVLTQINELLKTVKEEKCYIQLSLF